MKDILSRFSLESAKISGQTNAIAFFLWCILVGCAIWSINSQQFNKKGYSGIFVAKFEAGMEEPLRECV